MADSVNIEHRPWQAAGWVQDWDINTGTWWYVSDGITPYSLSLDLYFPRSLRIWISFQNGTKTPISAKPCAMLMQVYISCDNSMNSPHDLPGCTQILIVNSTVTSLVPPHATYSAETFSVLPRREPWPHSLCLYLSGPANISHPKPCSFPPKGFYDFDNNRTSLIIMKVIMVHSAVSR